MMSPVEGEREESLVDVKTPQYSVSSVIWGWFSKQIQSLNVITTNHRLTSGTQVLEIGRVARRAEQVPGNAFKAASDERRAKE